MQVPIYLSLLLSLPSVKVDRHYSVVIIFKMVYNYGCDFLYGSTTYYSFCFSFQVSGYFKHL